MSYRWHRAGLIVVRVVLPCWTLLVGAFLLWFGVRLHSRAPDDAWVIIGLSAFVIVASIVTLWWLNRRELGPRSLREGRDR